MSIMDFLPISLSPIAISLAVILAVLMIRVHLGTEKNKKRYHPVVATFLSALINFSRLHDYMTELACKHKTYRVLNLFTNFVFTTDPANVEYILKTNFANYGKGLYLYNILSDGLGSGIFAVDGEKWVHLRKVASNELSTKAVRDFSGAVFKNNGVKLARIISEAATSDQAIDIQDLFMKAALDSIVKVLLGIEVDTMYGTNEEATRFSNAFDVVNEMTLYRCVDFSWKIKKLLDIGSEAMLRKNLKVVDEFVYNLIKSKTETVPNSGDDPHLKRRDIVSRLLESRETDPKYLRDMIFSLVVAGKDTTASTLSWFIYMICKHPHIQEKIAQELREATNMKDNSSIDELADNLTEEALDKMQYLVAALTETTRLYPAVPLNAKICSCDDTWPDGFSVKKGDLVGYHAYGMGRMKFLWGDDAEEFRPERWLDENGVFKQESSFKFTAFSAGPRICLGKDFAQRETTMFSAVLVGSYIFKLRDENKVANYKTKITHHIEGGLYVQASPRFAHAMQDLN
ncbi:cytochrome P450 704C1-like isoform X1 [Prunus dulcis]|uniref:cytochrome P450 704C1-like isoform X1 n=1 Tax=Prunus dulcis TaxID=3755 RepID=UPI001483C294|nr:cytochrome P450 704C1-like isoform X1 [Prunus dulcis]